MPRVDGPFKILEKENDNTYKVHLPRDYSVSATFNITDLNPYLEDEYLADFRAKFTQQRGLMEVHQMSKIWDLKSVKEV